LDLNDTYFQETQESWVDIFNSTVWASDTIDIGLEVTVVRKSSSDCAGSIEQQVCDLRPASVPYDVRLDDPNVMFLSPTPDVSNDISSLIVWQHI
jgi:hypothetical protein